MPIPTGQQNAKSMVSIDAVTMSFGSYVAVQDV
ncbi:ABC transporter ATP-binding protein, partial [Rhizobium leguminosarum bv. viciae]